MNQFLLPIVYWNQIDVPKHPISYIHITVQQSYFVSCTTTGQIAIWRVEGNKKNKNDKNSITINPICLISGHNQPITCITDLFHDLHKAVVSVFSDGSLIITKVSDGFTLKCVRKVFSCKPKQILLHQSNPRCLLASGQSEVIEIVDLITFKVVQQLLGHNSWVIGMAICPPSDQNFSSHGYLVSIDCTGIILWWVLPSQMDMYDQVVGLQAKRRFFKIKNIKKFDLNYLSISFSPNHRLLLIVSSDLLFLYDSMGHDCHLQISLPSQSIKWSGAFFLTNNYLLAWTTENSSAIIFELKYIQNCNKILLTIPEIENSKNVMNKDNSNNNNNNNKNKLNQKEIIIEGSRWNEQRFPIKFEYKNFLKKNNHEKKNSKKKDHGSNKLHSYNNYNQRLEYLKKIDNSSQSEITAIETKILKHGAVKGIKPVCLLASKSIKSQLVQFQINKNNYFLNQKSKKSKYIICATKEGEIYLWDISVILKKISLAKNKISEKEELIIIYSGSFSNFSNGWKEREFNNNNEKEDQENNNNEKEQIKIAKENENKKENVNKKKEKEKINENEKVKEIENEKKKKEEKEIKIDNNKEKKKKKKKGKGKGKEKENENENKYKKKGKEQNKEILRLKNDQDHENEEKANATDSNTTCSLIITNEKFVPSYLIEGKNDGKILLRKIPFETELNNIQYLKGHSGKITSLLYPNNAVSEKIVDELLISSSQDSTICIWELKTGKLLKTFCHHTHSITHLFEPPITCTKKQKSYIGSISKDKSVSLICLRKLKVCVHFTAHIHQISGILWKLTNDYLLIECQNLIVYCWSLNGILERTKSIKNSLLKYYVDEKLDSKKFPFHTIHSWQLIQFDQPFNKKLNNFNKNLTRRFKLKLQKSLSAPIKLNSRENLLKNDLNKQSHSNTNSNSNLNPNLVHHSNSNQEKSEGKEKGKGNEDPNNRKINQNGDSKSNRFKNIIDNFVIIENSENENKKENDKDKGKGGNKSKRRKVNEGVYPEDKQSNGIKNIAKVLQFRSQNCVPFPVLLFNIRKLIKHLDKIDQLTNFQYKNPIIQFLSYLLPWGFDKQVDEIVKKTLTIDVPTPKISLGIIGDGGILTIFVPNMCNDQSTLWSFSSVLTAIFSLILVSIGRVMSFSNKIAFQTVSSMLLNNCCASIPILIEDYVEPSFEILSKFWQDENIQIQQSSRTIFGNVIDQKSRKENNKLVSFWDTRFSTTESTINKSTALLVLGMIAIRKKSNLRKAIRSKVAINLLRMLTSDPKIENRALAVWLLGKGFSMWKQHLENPKDFFRYIFVLTKSTDHKIAKTAKQSLLLIGKASPYMFLQRIKNEALRHNQTFTGRAYAIKLLMGLVQEYREVLDDYIKQAVEIVIQILNNESYLQASNDLYNPIMDTLEQLKQHSPRLTYGKTKVGVGTADGNVLIYELHSGEELIQFQAHTQNVNKISFNENEKFLATFSNYEKNLKIWNVYIPWFSSNLVIKQLYVFKIKNFKVNLNKGFIVDIKIIWKDKSISLQFMKKNKKRFLEKFDFELK
ncbi:rabconnectin-3b [Anaeramoeba flamelloides]|uniref:Rabconnectin-3b n=1 Tax=Anaeramoeba flamelloides TaxID=1746091 RepID=A0ABQ8XXW0_9EUKA|nr:rabconnectin-3b [Anaeramoeba flamelloides]